MSNGNVFMFAFSREGFESIVNLTAIDEAYIMAKMQDQAVSVQNVNSILSMMQIRARFNEHRHLEVWLVKLDDSFTEEALIELSEKDPQAAADIGRMGEIFYPKQPYNKQHNVIT